MEGMAAGRSFATFPSQGKEGLNAVTAVSASIALGKAPPACQSKVYFTNSPV